MAAITDGADGFECDLRLTKDNQVIIWHDSNMLRMANHKAVVAHTEYSELKGIYPELMLLTELLEIAKKAKKALALETKHPVPSGNLGGRWTDRHSRGFHPRCLDCGLANWPSHLPFLKA